MSHAPASSSRSIGGWEVSVINRGISSTASEEDLSASLSLNLPTMVFATSSLSLARPHGATLSFCARDALADVGAADDRIRVRAAGVWGERAAKSGVAVEKLAGAHARDWTFTTEYAGTLEKAEEVAEGGEREEIDYDVLKDTSVPIEFFGETLLFEDELDDNGVASYRVRIRCMPDCLFVLARFFLRVDGVLVRVLDTRYFHRYTSALLVRETSRRECSLDPLPSSLSLSDLRNADLVASKLPVSERRVQNFRVAGDK